MVMNTAKINGAAAVNAAASVGETAKSVKAWFGRICTKGTHAVKEVASKIASAIVEFFKNFSHNIKTGYGIGAVYAGIGGGLLITSLCLNKEKHAVPRAILTIAAAGLFFAAGAVMFAFGKNPVSFTRAAV